MAFLDPSLTQSFASDHDLTQYGTWEDAWGDFSTAYGDQLGRPSGPMSVPFAAFTDDQINQMYQGDFRQWWESRHPGEIPSPPSVGVITVWTPEGYPEIWEVPVDENGSPLWHPYDDSVAGGDVTPGTLQQSYEDQWNSIQGIADETFDFDPNTEGVQSDFGSWAEGQGIETNEIGSYLSAIDEIIDALDNGTVDEQELAAHRARQLGFNTVEEMEQAFNELTESLYMADQGDLSAMQGFSEEERELRERYKENATRNMQQLEREMLDNVLASSGSRTQFLRNADEALGRIQDQELAYGFAMAQEEYERKSAEFDRKKDLWGQMVQLGQMSEDQFLQNVRADRSLAMQGLSTQASLALQENQQYLNTYQADLNAANAYVTAAFNELNAELGIDAAALETSSQMYAQLLAPWQTAMAEWEAQHQVWVDEQEFLAAQQAAGAAATGSAIGMAGDVIAAGASILLPLLLM